MSEHGNAKGTSPILKSLINLGLPTFMAIIALYLSTMQLTARKVWYGVLAIVIAWTGLRIVWVLREAGRSLRRVFDRSERPLRDRLGHPWQEYVSLGLGVLALVAGGIWSVVIGLDIARDCEVGYCRLPAVSVVAFPTSATTSELGFIVELDFQPLVSGTLDCDFTIDGELHSTTCADPAGVTVSSDAANISVSVIVRTPNRRTLGSSSTTALARVPIELTAAKGRIFAGQRSSLRATIDETLIGPDFSCSWDPRPQGDIAPDKTNPCRATYTARQVGNGEAEIVVRLFVNKREVARASNLITVVRPENHAVFVLDATARMESRLGDAVTAISARAEELNSQGAVLGVLTFGQADGDGTTGCDRREWVLPLGPLQPTEVTAGAGSIELGTSELAPLLDAFEEAVDALIPFRSGASEWATYQVVVVTAGPDTCSLRGGATLWQSIGGYITEVGFASALDQSKALLLVAAVDPTGDLAEGFRERDESQFGVVLDVRDTETLRRVVSLATQTISGDFSARAQACGDLLVIAKSQEDPGAFWLDGFCRELENP